MTNAKEPVRVFLHAPPPPSKEELHAKLSDFKRRLREELTAPSNVTYVPPPWNNDRSKEWILAEKMAWWATQPVPKAEAPSVDTEFRTWLKEVYRKHIPI
ncbi:hypothetical protein H0H87_003559, partial [Tephrocybe sp. NHM501043]